MTDEYTYFRAGGLTHDAIIVVEAARAEIDALRKALSQKFGAYNMYFDLHDGKCRIHSFGYNREQDIPDGWQKVEHGQVTFRRMPPDGSADYFTLLSHQGQLTRHLRRSDLGFFLDIPPMPAVALPAGYYSQRFVRKQTYTSEARAYLGPKPEPADHGIYKESGDALPSATKPIAYQQRVTFLKYDGVYYVRVPNDGQGQPLWVPPNSARVGYNDMLALDSRVFAQRFYASTPRPRFGV